MVKIPQQRVKSVIRYGGSHNKGAAESGQREKFNTYKFVDYKGEVVTLIGQVTAVSIQTMQIIAEIEAAQR